MIFRFLMLGGPSGSCHADEVIISVKGAGVVQEPVELRSGSSDVEGEPTHLVEARKVRREAEVGGVGAGWEEVHHRVDLGFRFAVHENAVLCGGQLLRSKLADARYGNRSRNSLSQQRLSTCCWLQTNSCDPFKDPSAYCVNRTLKSSPSHISCCFCA